LHDKFAEKKGWAIATKDVITAVEVSKGRVVKGVIHNEDDGKPVGSFELALIGSKAIEASSNLGSNVECFGEETLEKKEANALKSIGSVQIKERKPPDGGDNASPAFKLTSSAKKRKAEEANVDGNDEWLNLVPVNVGAASKPVWANRVLKANKSDTCVANTSNATPNTQKKESGKRGHGKDIKNNEKGDKVKKHETGKPKAAAKKGAKDKKDTNLPLPSLGMLIESQISSAENLLRQFARSEEQALVLKAKLKRATTNVSKHLTEDLVKLLTSPCLRNVALQDLQRDHVRHLNPHVVAGFG